METVVGSVADEYASVTLAHTLFRPWHVSGSTWCSPGEGGASARRGAEWGLLIESRCLERFRVAREKWRARA